MDGLAMPSLGHLGAVPYHISYATRDLEEAMAAFSALFGHAWGPVGEGVIPGLGPVDTAGWTSRRVVSLGGPVHVELSQGSAASIWATEELATLHHLAYWCADLRAAVTQLVDEGWHLELTLPDQAGEPTEFAYVTREDWPRLELVDVARAPAFIVDNHHDGPAGRALRGATS